MKKIYLIVMLLMTGMMAEAQTSVWNGSRRLWTSGEGTESNPYLIESAEQLAFLSYMVNKGLVTTDLNFKLTTDIDLNGSEDLPWVPIGLGDRWFSEDGCERLIDPSYTPVYFCGHFDGNGHSIYNLYVDGGTYVGLFGLVSGQGSLIENLNIENGYVNGTYSGGIIGQCTGAVDILNCLNSAEIVGTEAAGGIVGQGGNVIRNCSNSGHIVSSSYAGGIAGSLAKELYECFNTGGIIVNGSAAGGILGRRGGGKLIIVNCYNRGNLSGNATHGIGGIAGIANGNTTDIRNCYNVGSITNDSGNAGGLFGYDNVNNINNVYYLNNCGGLGPGEDKTAEEMRDPAFVDLLNLNTNVWGYDEDNINDGYPILTSTLMSTEETVVNTMSVYPNPAKSSFTVEGTGLLSITNVLGQTVMEKPIEEMSIITLSEGIYLLRLTEGNSTVTKKVIVY
jgi:hypothetical protein